jgi:hypothetical protein
MEVQQYVLFSGGARGTEEYFGKMAEKYGVQEVNYTFEGHSTERTRGLRFLTSEELARKDVSLTYVSKLMNRKFTRAPLFRKVLQSISWQVDSGEEVFVVGTILEDGTVKGGTGWGAEFAKICNKNLYVFDQNQDAWFMWKKEAWEKTETPAIARTHFTGTGTRFLEDNGRLAIDELFEKNFG